MINETAFSTAGVGQQSKLNVAPVIAATALVASGVILLIQQVIGPNINIGEAATIVLPAVLANMPSYELDQWLSHAFNILLVPGLVGVAVLAYQHSARLAYFGAQITLIGHLFHGATSVFEGVVIKEMALVPNNPPEVAGLLDQINQSSGVVPFLILMLLFNGGLLLVAVGLWRKHLVAGWVAMAAFLGIGVHVILPASFMIDLVAALLFLAFIIGVGLNLIKLSGQTR